jgi:hypothetical protein
VNKVHLLVTNDDTSTACKIRLFGRSHGPAPLCSTNPEHVTCTDCTTAARNQWLDTHCYSCGKEFEKPISALTDDEMLTANADHEACFN